MVQQAIGNHRSSRCFMRDTQVTLDMDGQFSVCCVESPSSPKLGNYLEESWSSMQHARVTSDLCAKCIKKESISLLPTATKSRLRSRKPFRRPSNLI